MGLFCTRRMTSNQEKMRGGIAWSRCVHVMRNSPLQVKSLDWTPVGELSLQSGRPSIPTHPPIHPSIHVVLGSNPLLGRQGRRLSHTDSVVQPPFFCQPCRSTRLLETNNRGQPVLARSVPPTTFQAKVQKVPCVSWARPSTACSAPTPAACAES